MHRLRTVFGVTTPLLLGAALLISGSQSASAACQLRSPSGHVKRVVHIVFDNVHLRRDNPNVAGLGVV